VAPYHHHCEQLSLNDPKMRRNLAIPSRSNYLTDVRRRQPLVVNSTLMLRHKRCDPCDPVDTEQVRSSYAHLPLTLSVSVVNSVLLGFVMASAAAVSTILVWIGLVLSLSAIRMVLWHEHSRRDVGSELDPRWTRIATAGSLASGILWGCSTILFFPLDEMHLLFLALVISGMCAGSATVHAAHFPSVAAFILPAILPLTVNFFMQGNKLAVVSGIMACVFGISLCLASLRFRKWFRETTSARIVLAIRTSEAAEANARLRTEIADHRSTEARLQQAQKMEAIGLLTAGVAHDFNNLLLAIGGSAELIARHHDSDPEDASLFETIKHSVGRGATLTQQLLTVGRKQTLVPCAADMNEVLQGMEALLATTLGGYASLALQLDPSPVSAFVDIAQLEHAILNLVINARDAMPNSGLITISTVNIDGHAADSAGLVGSFVMITVSDTGTGMSESVRLHAFDPFFTTKEFGRGSGLGLSQVYGLVKQSGGETHIDSRLGRGTTVSIYLPRASQDMVSTQDVRKPRVNAAPTAFVSNSLHEGRRILVLDDDRLVLETVTEILSSAGYTVVPFDSALQALEEVNKPDPIDLMIVDFAMPEMRGDQFAAKARSRRSAVPIVFISGYAEPASLQSESYVLRKPFSLHSLISTTEEAMQIAA
jgi:signal transduction histidine kinase/CheY-like chemotaxis protein